MQIRQLKVKIKSLAAEQSIIKHETRKAKQERRWLKQNGSGSTTDTPESLIAHRVHHVRPEIRSANIAYGFLRGKTLEQIELPRSAESLARKPYREPDWKRIERLISKYGGTSALLRMSAWKKAA